MSLFVGIHIGDMFLAKKKFKVFARTFKTMVQLALWSYFHISIHIAVLLFTWNVIKHQDRAFIYVNRERFFLRITTRMVTTYWGHSVNLMNRHIYRKFFYGLHNHWQVAVLAKNLNTIMVEWTYKLMST